MLGWQFSNEYYTDCRNGWKGRDGNFWVRPVAEVVGFKGERHKPWYRSVTPLDARGLPTFN
jgi:hypothetical protein